MFVIQTSCTITSVPCSNVVRSSISRGLVKVPSILILDDSTSALDARSDNLVNKGLEENYSDTTILIVAQKISSIVNCDKIIVMRDGRVDSLGTHKELLNTSELYNEIFISQKGDGR